MAVVWLDASAEVLAERTGPHDAARPPLLRDPDGVALTPLDEARVLRARREAVYRRVSDVVLSNESDPESAVRRLLGGDRAHG